MVDHRINGLWQRSLERAMKARTLQPCDEWCEDNIRLSSRFTSRPGPLRLDETPFFRQPHKWFSDPKISKIVAMTSAQVAKSTWLSNCMTFSICEDPGPILYVTSTEKSAKAWWKREWRPRSEDTRALKELKPSNPDDFTIWDMQFTTCTMSVIAGQSPNDAASRPIRFLFVDEADKLADPSEKEAGVLELLIVRTRSFEPKQKVVIASTPTTKKGNIYKEFLAGSQHRYLVRCPECNGQFRFVFREENQNGGVFWPDECKVDGVWDLTEVKRRAYYKCPHCECHIKQSQKRRMIDRGEWVQHNFKCRPEDISFHINTLYSLSWGRVAELFLMKKDKPGGLQDFHNSDLGEPYEVQSGGVNDSAINAIVAKSPEYYTPSHVKTDRSREAENVYKIKIPLKETFVAKRLAITLTVDVQQHSYWWAMRLWMDDLSSFLLDYGQCLTYEDVTKLGERRIDFCDGEPLMGVFIGLIDSGYRTKGKEGGVYDFCMQSGGRFVASKGFGKDQAMAQPAMEDVLDYLGQRIPFVKYRDNLIKDWLYEQTIRHGAGPGWYLPRNICPTYRAQLQDEKIVESIDTHGNEVSDYVSGNNNHLADCEKMQFVLREILVKPLAAVRHAKKAKEAKEARLSEARQENGKTVRNYVLR